MKSFFNIFLIVKALLFYIAVSIIVIIAVKFWGDFPTYPPSTKNPISWGEVFERFQFILLSSLTMTVFYVYGLYLEHLKKKKTIGKNLKMKIWFLEKQNIILLILKKKHFLTELQPQIAK